MTLRKLLENIFERGENACNQHFLLPEKMFVVPKTGPFVQEIYNLLYTKAFNLKVSKMLFV